MCIRDRIYKEIPVSKFIRIQRLRWAGHVMRMEGGRNPKRALLGTWERTRPRGRPRKRWEDGVAEDARDMRIRNWRRAVSYTHLDVYKRQVLKHTIKTINFMQCKFIPTHSIKNSLDLVNKIQELYIPDKALSLIHI